MKLDRLFGCKPTQTSQTGNLQLTARKRSTSTKSAMYLLYFNLYLGNGSEAPLPNRARAPKLALTAYLNGWASEKPFSHADWLKAHRVLHPTTTALRNGQDWSTQCLGPAKTGRLPRRPPSRSTIPPSRSPGESCRLALEKRV